MPTKFGKKTKTKKTKSKPSEIEPDSWVFEWVTEPIRRQGGYIRYMDIPEGRLYQIEHRDSFLLHAGWSPLVFVPSHIRII